ncbi:23S rRNA (adenine(2503)-C(2))-methyltransferase RlmN [Oligoflexaceae bacterium]|nr:23S rRNA (adenine(2503)-C(2))-methyltransferase RlmN [Oligoflexaceae bacterium]
MTTKVHILEPDTEALCGMLAAMGEPKFRGKQVVDWIYKKGIVDPDLMLNVPKQTREKLRDSFSLAMPDIESQITSADGTTKLLLRSHRRHMIETVIMRYDERTTLCVSSQVGCKLACSFCQTGKLGFFRHLQTSEILAQLHMANAILAPENRKISNIVFMGMGEPLDNYDAVLASVHRMIDEPAYNLSSRHVTVSTSGLCPQIKRFATESKASLAVSLHSADPDTRTSLMPINRKYDLVKLKEALMEFQDSRNRKITIEYILIRDQTCSPLQAKKLVSFLHGLKAKVNLIPFNDHPGSEYGRPSDKDIAAFQKYLVDRGYPAPVRYSRGLEVSAACGQLAAKSIGELGDVPTRGHMVQKTK